MSDTFDIYPLLNDIIDAHIARHPRTQQVELGPSQIGCACDRCLIHMLAGHDTVGDDLWLATIGTAVHAWLEDALTAHAWEAPDGDRWHAEAATYVGDLGGTDVIGHSDVFDAKTGTVVDWKVVGTDTAKKVAKYGPSVTYQRQAHMYGRGWSLKGYDVRTVAIVFLPRTMRARKANTKVWANPYQPAVAEYALARANGLLAGIRTIGVDRMLAMAPPHTGDEFTCGKWPGETTPDMDRQLDGLILPTATAAGTNPKENA